VDTAAAIIAGLRAGGTEAEPGEFSLDPSEAARRFEEFRYADREAFLVPLVEGLRLLGATAALEIRTRGADLDIYAPGLTLQNARRRLHELYAAPFSGSGSVTDYAMTRLAVAIDMGLRRASIIRIAISYGSPDGGVLVEYRPDASPEVTSLPPGDPVDEGIRVVVDGGLEAELDAIVDDPHAPAFDRLRRAVRYTPGGVTINDVEITQGPRPLSYGREEGDGGTRVRHGYDEVPEPPRLLLLSGDVVVDSIALERDRHRASHGFVSLVPIDRPARDLSQMTVIRDDGIEEAIRRASAVERSLPAAPAQRRPISTSPPRSLGFVSLLIATIASCGAFTFDKAQGHYAWENLTADWVREGAPRTAGSPRPEAVFFFELDGQWYRSGEKVAAGDRATGFAQPETRRLSVWVDPDDPTRIAVDGPRRVAVPYETRVVIAGLFSLLSAPLMAYHRLRSSDRARSTRLLNLLLLLIGASALVAGLGWTLAWVLG
jgi:hypothetical protein